MPYTRIHSSNSGKSGSGTEQRYKLKKQNQPEQSVPIPIHPDDAKDKVFVAIIKALLRLKNKPSSPKELANAVMRYKYATLGGATPYATVSSRISQHFKRAATHKPSRPPLLNKHYDERHSRRIYYSLAIDSPLTERSPSPSPSPSPQSSDNEMIGFVPAIGYSTDDPSFTAPSRVPRHGVKRPSSLGPPSLGPQRKKRLETKSEDEDNVQAEHIHIRYRAKSPPSPFQLQSRRRRRHEVESESEDDDEDFQHEQKRLRRQLLLLPLSPTTESPSVSSSSSQSSTWDEMSSDEGEHIQQSLVVSEDNESDEEDYHEEMLKGDDETADFNHSSSTLMRRPSIAQMSVCENRPRSDHGLTQPSDSIDDTHDGLHNDLWTVDYDTDLGSVFLAEDSTATATPASHDNVDSPESISVSDLDIYFDGDGDHNDSKHKLPTSAPQPVPAASRTYARSLSPSMDSQDRPCCNSTEASTTSAADVATTTHPLPRSRSMSWPQDGYQSRVTTLSKRTTVSETIPVDHTIKQIMPSTMRQIHGSKEYTITKKTYGSMECYQLQTAYKSSNIAVLRYIASTNGASEHVALRTRSTSNTRAKMRNMNHYYYLSEGYVNATQMLKASRQILGEVTTENSCGFDQDDSVVCLKSGRKECRGNWVPLSRARELTSEYKLDRVAGLAELLSDDPLAVEQENKDTLNK
ncbi:hypothetical protein BX666DRAFT_1133316 [Dichotomocladium elegans]|nr:hypothetical protein BX666DRAFT_1133316 [Dichotomocladium elegans]